MKNTEELKTTIDRIDIIKNKYYLFNIYKQYYSEFKRNIRNLPEGKIVELGSGGGFIKEIIPNAITSDIMELENCDLCFSALKMPFKKNSVAAFLMLNVFHHIKDPESALKEMSRCLKKNGKIIMIEPSNSFLSRTIHKFIKIENFDTSLGWKIRGNRPLSDANQALPFIIFNRDRNIFEKKFPNFKIIKNAYHTPLKYVISGGFSFNQLLPDITFNLVTKLEKILKPLNKWFGMFTTIIIKKI